MNPRRLNVSIVALQAVNLSLLSLMSWASLTKSPLIEEAISVIALDVIFLVILVLGFRRGQKSQLFRRILVRCVYYFACGLLLLSITGFFIQSMNLVMYGIGAGLITVIFLPLCEPPYYPEKEV